MFWFIGSLLLAFILVPLIGLATVQSAGNLARVAAMPDVRQAIWLSLLAAFLPAGGLLAGVAAGLAHMNVALGVFNLLPLPQLDGGNCDTGSRGRRTSTATAATRVIDLGRGLRG